MTRSYRIPLSIPYLGAEEKLLVNQALDDGWVSSAGPLVGEFENAIAQLVQVEHAIATSSGTAAIHLALAASGIGSGDAVVVPDLTFIGSINPIAYVGASPVLIDVRESDGTIDVDALRRYLDDGCERRDGVSIDRATGARVRAVMPVHLYGSPADLVDLAALAAERELFVIEDAAEALGSSLNGRPTGSWGSLGCLSFNGNKIVTTGGGGMVVTHDADFAKQARYLSTQARDDPREYRHNAIGFNYRLTNLQAALGLGQIATIEDRLARRRGVAARYRERLAGTGLRFLEPARSAISNNWLVSIVLDDAKRREALIATLDAAGIEGRAFFVPVHMQRPYSSARRWGDLRVAERIYAGGVNLPSSTGVSLSDVDEVSETVRSVLEARAPTVTQ